MENYDEYPLEVRELLHKGKSQDLDLIQIKKFAGQCETDTEIYKIIQSFGVLFWCSTLLYTQGTFASENTVLISADEVKLMYTEVKKDLEEMEVEEDG